MHIRSSSLAAATALALAVLTFAPLALGGSIDPTKRLFMVEFGADPETASNHVAIAANQCLRLSVWYQDQNELGCDNCFQGGIGGYQVFLPYSVAGGDSGTISYLDLDCQSGDGCSNNCDSISIDQDRDDWLFANSPCGAAQAPCYVENLPGDRVGSVFGLFGCSGVCPAPGGDVPNPGGPNYVTDFEYCASPDASGTFQLSFIGLEDAPPLTYFDDQSASGLNSCQPVLQPLIVVVARCGNGVVEPGEDCDDGNLENADGCSDDCRFDELIFLAPAMTPLGMIVLMVLFMCGLCVAAVHRSRVASRSPSGLTSS